MSERGIEEKGRGKTKFPSSSWTRCHVFRGDGGSDDGRERENGTLRVSLFGRSKRQRPGSRWGESKGFALVFIFKYATGHCGIPLRLRTRKFPLRRAVSARLPRAYGFTSGERYANGSPPRQTVTLVGPPLGDANRCT